MATDEQDQNASTVSDEETVAGEPVNLQRAYSRLHGAITALFDGLGVHRSATVPHVKGEQMHEHLAAIGKVLPTIGGVTANFLTATHTQHDPNGGATVAHPSHKLREAVIPADSKNAKAAISAGKSFVSKVAGLLGDEDPAVQKAKSQVALLGHSDGRGMTAMDLGAGLLAIPGPLIQKLSRMHSGMKSGGHSPQLRAPHPEMAPQGQETATAAPGASQGAPVAA